jgi:protein SCO1/2
MRTERIHPALIPLIAMAACVATLRAQVIMDEPPDRARDLTPEVHLGDRVPLDLQLTDDTGRPVVLGDYFKDGRPVVLVMGYFDCPLLCTLVFEGLARSFAPLSYEPGEDYQVVVVSFDPTNTTEQARARKTSTIEQLGVNITPNVMSGWAFHTADAETSRRLAEAVGYKYRYIEGNGEYAHAAVIMVLTPDGTLARYLFGIDHAEKDLRLALLEASDARIADGLGDYFLHLCYTWDPDSEGYVVEAMTVMRIGAAGGGAILIGLLIWLKLRERVWHRTGEPNEGRSATTLAMGR